PGEKQQAGLADAHRPLSGPMQIQAAGAQQVQLAAVGGAIQPGIATERTVEEGAGAQAELCKQRRKWVHKCSDWMILYDLHRLLDLTHPNVAVWGLVCNVTHRTLPCRTYFFIPWKPPLRPVARHCNGYSRP